MADDIPRSEFGESFVGDGVNAAHVNTVLGGKGGPVETAWVTALATPRPGHVAFVCTVAPGVAVQPATLFVNKATIEGARHAELTWGAAQAGVAAGIMDAVQGDAVLTQFAPGRLIVAVVWVNPEADDAAAVFANNREAAQQAIVAGRQGLPSMADAFAAAAHPSNAYFSGPA